MCANGCESQDRQQGGRIGQGEDGQNVEFVGRWGHTDCSELSGECFCGQRGRPSWSQTTREATRGSRATRDHPRRAACTKELRWKHERTIMNASIHSHTISSNNILSYKRVSCKHGVKQVWKHLPFVEVSPANAFLTITRRSYMHANCFVYHSMEENNCKNGLLYKYIHINMFISYRKMPLWNERKQKCKFMHYILH